MFNAFLDVNYRKPEQVCILTYMNTVCMHYVMWTWRKSKVSFKLNKGGNAASI